MMKEEIILSNINERELTKTLAINGINSFNTRIFNAVDLAKEALLRNGHIITSRQITETKQECVIYDILKNVDYFKECSFLDAKNINNAITYARKLCRGNEDEKINEVLSEGEFLDKNIAILQVYKEYKKYLKDNNYTDSIEIINSSIEKGCSIDAEFIVFNETPLDPLEEELLNIVSNNNNSKQTIREYTGKQYKELRNVTYANAYGSVNEVEYILGYIARNNIRYDDSVVVLLDSSYSEHFLNYKDIYNVPMTFGIGQDLSLSNSFKLLTLLDRWNKQYNAINSLNDLIYAPEFNTNKFWNNISDKELDNRTKSEIIKTIGNLKLSIYKNNKLEEYEDTLIDKKEIERYQYVEKFANELYKGYSYLIKTYTNINDETIENKAIETITTYIDDYFENLPEKNVEKDLPQQLEDIIVTLINQKILREASKPGFLHITNLQGALSTIKKHLFICGLNAKTFPGSPTEDYLLLDEDLKRFNESNVKDSSNKIKLNKELLLNVVKNASAFNCEIHLSYSGYSLSDLKIENPSSILFELFKLEFKDATTKQFEEAIGKQHKYFDESISSLSDIGNKYLNGNLVEKQNTDGEDANSSSRTKHTISSSSADVFFTCPKRFYLTKILGIIEPEEDDPFNTLPSNDEGTLVHKCMEDYGNHPNWTLEEFMNNADMKFEDYFKSRIPLHNKNKAYLKNEYLRMAKNGFESDPSDKEVIASEKYLGPYKDPITGLSFGGYVDRLEKLSNGKYRIVDYKTYKEKKNNEFDIDTCFQVALYAYILENNKEETIEVDDCEYRYLRNPMTIKVGYEDIKNNLENKLLEIKNALDTGDFPYAKDTEEACKYCKLKDICGIEKEKNNG